MGSECNPSKRHYDITMSKRTRKQPLMNLQEANHANTIDSSKGDMIPPKGDGTGTPWDRPRVSPFDGNVPGDESSPTPRKADDEEEESDRKSLKQLINGDGNAAEKEESVRSGRSSLGHHFTEEEKQLHQLQLVKKQQQDGVQGLNLKGMMSRYAKVLSHLVKMKREPRIASRKKQLLRLTT